MGRRGGGARRRRGTRRARRSARIAPVVLNARAAARAELGGVERWARELAARLPTLAPGRYRIARPPPALAHRAGHAWEQLALPALAMHAGASLILGPANLAPLAWPRNVVVIHDAAALREPSWYSAAYARWQRALLPRIAARAAAIITPSEFSRAEVVELLGAAADRVHVVPGGVGERFSPAADSGRARTDLGLRRPYVLTVASRTARKNLEALEPAARALAREGVEIVAAGGERPQFRDDAPSGTVRLLGRVDDALLPGLYAGACAFVLPSRHEGFGLTALEAMASGVPIVVSRAGALPETCADAALYADPDDPGSFTGALARAIGDRRLAAAGRERAAAFTWERAARGVDAVVHGALRSS